MKNDIQLINESTLVKYNNAILNFEEYLKQLYNKEKIIEINKGYLINLEDYEDLKEKINYTHFKENILNNNLDNESLSDSDEIIKIKQIDFKTSSYLLNMIYNDNKYFN